MAYANNKKLIIALAVLALLVVGWFVFFKSDTESVNENAATSALEKTADGKVRVVGDIECLPYRKPSEDQGCVKGIKDSEGRYFSLNSFAVKGLENTLPLGTTVEAIGTYEPADKSNSESSVFVYDGVLVLTSLKRQ